MNPPAMAKFFKKEINCIWSEKLEWNIIASNIEKKESITAANLALYPMITSNGKRISIMMAGVNK